MNGPYFIGLSSWIIEDGNYQDFKRGDRTEFALEFSAPKELATMAGTQATAFEHLHESTYRIVGKVIHVRELEWWAIDVGIRMYRSGRPPKGIEEGCWVSGEIYVGVDPFHYLERFSRHHTAPGLIYSWTINKIELNTAPWIRSEEGHMMRDPEKAGWLEIETTSAPHSAGPPEYVLHCELLDDPPHR